MQFYLLSLILNVLLFAPPPTLDLHNVKAEPAVYRGRNATRVTDAAPPNVNDAERLAVMKETSFQNGVIDIDLAGDTAPDAPPEFRGFVGIAFRVSADASHFECIYLRPKNGRSPDQLQRNHSTQYISVPGFPWEKLRAETPGKYESYVDLVPGAWTHVKITVTGTTAQLFVNGSEQPVLLVNDLKQPISSGAVAFWIGPGTIAHFTNPHITPK